MSDCTLASPQGWHVSVRLAAAAKPPCACSFVADINSEPKPKPTSCTSLQAFQQAAGSAQCPEDQLQVLRSAHLPPAHDGALTPLPPQDPLWQLACVAAALPGAIHCLHTVLAESHRGLAQEQVQVPYSLPPQLACRCIQVSWS